MFLWFWDEYENNWKRKNQDGRQRPEATMQAKLRLYVEIHGFSGVLHGEGGLGTYPPLEN